MRFSQPTDYSPGTGNTVLLPCQLSSCHPPSQHMGCVRSKKAAEQLSAEFLPPLPPPAQRSHWHYWQLSELPTAVQRIQGQAGTQGGNDSPSSPWPEHQCLIQRILMSSEEYFIPYATENKILQNVYATHGGTYGQITSDLTPSACPFPSSALLPVLLN